MITILAEPLDSSDPEVWEVYSDNLEDRGIDPTRARNIAKGIRKTGGKLFLIYHNSYSNLNYEAANGFSSMWCEGYHWELEYKFTHTNSKEEPKRFSFKKK